jgi:uncharacterized low-complexity protein
MRIAKLITMFLGATLFLALTATTASAQMKCGAGKCGASMAKSSTPKGCACEDCDKHPDCAAKKDPSKPCDCADKGEMKCGAGKCGSAKPKPAMKCGAGKCG